MYDFKRGNIENCAFEAGVLGAANDESVHVFTQHGIVDVFESPVDFHLAWQRLPPKIRSLYAAKLRGGQCVHLGDIHQRLDSHLFSFYFPLPAGMSEITGFNSVTP